MRFSVIYAVSRFAAVRLVPPHTHVCRFTCMINDIPVRILIDMITQIHVYLSGSGARQVGGALAMAGGKPKRMKYCELGAPT